MEYIKQAILKEKPTATRVEDMGVEKNGTRNTLYITKTSLGTHWFVRPDSEATKYKLTEKAQNLIEWLDL